MTGSQSLLRSGQRLKETSTCSLMRRSQNTLTAKATAVLLHLLQLRHHFQFIYIQALILGTSLDPGTGKNPWDAEGTSDEDLKFSRDEESGPVIRQHCWMRHLYESYGCHDELASTVWFKARRFFSPSPGGQNSEAKVLAGLVSLARLSGRKLPRFQCCRRLWTLSLQTHSFLHSRLHLHTASAMSGSPSFLLHSV